MADDSGHNSGVDASGTAAKPSFTHRALPAVLVLVALGLLVSLWRIDGVLGALHQPGAASYRIDDLSGATSFVWDTSRPAKVLATWSHAPWRHGSDSSPTAVATWYLVLDFVFIAVYTTLLVGMVRGLRTQLTEVANEPGLVDRIAAMRRRRRGSQPARPDEDAERTVELAFINTYVTGGRWAIRAVVLAAAVDVAEDVLELLMVRSHVDGTAAYVALYSVTVAKWLLLIAVFLYLAAAGYTVAQRHVIPGDGPTQLGCLIKATGVLRAQIIVVLAWIGGIFLAEQTPDILHRWLDATTDGAAAGAASFGVALTLVLCLAVLTSGRLMLVQWHKDWTYSISLWGSLGTAAAIALTAGVLYGTGHGGAPLIVPAAIAVAVAVGELVLRHTPAGLTPSPPECQSSWTQTLVELIAIAPLAALGLGLLHASVADAVFTRELRYRWLVGGGMFLIALTAALWGARKHLWFPERDRVVLRITCGAALAVAVVIEVNHWPSAEWVGTIGIVAVFSVLASGLAYLGTWIAERVRPPKVVVLLRLRRIPVFTLVVVWAVLGSKLNDGQYHNVRTVDGQHATVTLTDAFADWRTANKVPLEGSGSTSAEDGTTRPMVLVAAEGGGIRAAYWTALAMDCMFSGGQGGTDMTDCPARSVGTAPVFAASGASGGSVGLATYMAHQFETTDATDWVRARLGGDYVSPTVAQGFFADLPDAFLGIHGLWDDRAAILERSWQREWPGGQFATLSPSRIWDGGKASSSADSHRFPLLLLNGTSVTDGCRINTSVLNAAIGKVATGPARPDACSSLVPFEPPPDSGAHADWTLAGTKDLSDFLCPDSDVRLSTAALLSARFPYVTPYGRLAPCAGHPGPPTSYDVDGGYLDNTGVTPLLQIWQKLAPLVQAYNQEPGTPCLIPLFVQIDNHYVAAAGPDPVARPSQLAAPPQTVKSSRDGEEANARQAAAVTFGRVVADVDGQNVLGYAHIYPRSHPGSQAPLGWTLSAGSMDDLEKQLRIGNGDRIGVVANWFSNQLKPAGPTGSNSSWCGTAQSP